MNTMQRTLCLALPCALLFACSRTGDSGTPIDHDEAGHEQHADDHRIAVPPQVRDNLGIRFAPVERRRVAATLRLPGHFELLPAARTEQRTPLAGRVRIAVQPLQNVAAGELLYAIDSPEWRKLQRELGELRTAIATTTARIDAMPPLLDARRAHEDSLREATRVMHERVTSLEATRESVGGQAQELASARAQLAQTQAQLAEAAEQHIESKTRLLELQAELTAGTEHFRLALAAAATLLATTPEQLLGPVASVSPVTPMWQFLGEIEVRATTGGVVVDLPLASGAWVEIGGLVAIVADLGRVRFRAKCPQGDLPRLAPDLPARVVLPSDGALAPLAGTLQIGAEADPTQRTIDLFVTTSPSPNWARPGIAAFLEVETAAGRDAELAIPRAAVLQDGLQHVFFRRDPADPDRVLRVEADLGVDDGRWIEVKSGIVDGDQVVVAGAYELMLASSGTAAKGGHFHADGTFHAADHR